MPQIFWAVKSVVPNVAARSNGIFWPPQIASPTSGRNTQVASQSGIRANRMQKPMITGSTR